MDSRTSNRADSRRDQGFTLPELLITIAILGTITAVLAAAIVTTIRQQSSTEGRLNIARAEQSVDTWLPADIASADPTTVSADPLADPCGASCPADVDLSGVNALLMSWSVDEPSLITWTVSYRYVKIGSEWQLRRILCEEVSGVATCDDATVLHNLAPPGDGSPAAEAAFLGSPTAPSWAVSVTPPGPGGATTSVQFFVDGGADGAGDGRSGGVDEIILSAEGVVPDTIDPNSATSPSFVRAKSRCGGPMTMLIDSSGSIGAAMGDVREAVRAVVEGFRETPVKLRIIDFDLISSTLGSGYYDMAEGTQVDALKTLIGSGNLQAGGYTNWDDGWFRTFYQSNGNLRPLDELPNTVIFFTDGVPNRNRTTNRSDAAPTVQPAAYPSATWPRTDPFDQQSYDRAEKIAATFAGQTKYIGVAVGAGAANSYPWVQVADPYTQPPAPSTPRTGNAIVAELRSAGGVGDATVLAEPRNGPYTNATDANMYEVTNFNGFADALRSAALSDCGGTLTVQTRADGSPATEEFVYENPEFRDQASGTVVSTEARTVTTSQLFRTGTFDFDIPGGATYLVDLVPQSLGTLDDYLPDTAAGPGGWTCRAGAITKTPVLIPITDSIWSGITVPVGPNEAVSCTLSMTSI